MIFGEDVENFGQWIGHNSEANDIINIKHFYCEIVSALKRSAFDLKCIPKSISDNKQSNWRSQKSWQMRANKAFEIKYCLN